MFAASFFPQGYFNEYFKATTEPALDTGGLVSGKTGILQFVAPRRGRSRLDEEDQRRLSLEAEDQEILDFIVTYVLNHRPFD